MTQSSPTESETQAPAQDQSVESLFQPVRVGDATLKNRIVMAPMTRNRATPDHIPAEIMAEYYALRAEAGAHNSGGHITLSERGVIRAHARPLRASSG